MYSLPPVVGTTIQQEYKTLSKPYYYTGKAILAKNCHYDLKG
jgi:hypothetical protein